VEAASYTVGGVVGFLGRTISSGSVAISNSAYGALTDATNNTFVGRSCGSGITSGTGNVAVGYLAAFSITAGIDNVCIGRQAGDSLTSSDDNVFVGALAGQAVTVTDTEDANTCVGTRSGTNLTSGHTNSFLGANSGNGITTGDENVSIGAQSSGTTTSTGTVGIGYNASVDSGDYSIALGHAATVTAANQFMIGGTSNSITEIRPAVDSTTNLGSTSFRYASAWTDALTCGGVVDAASYTEAGRTTVPVIDDHTDSGTMSCTPTPIVLSAVTACTAFGSGAGLGGNNGTAFGKNALAVCTGTNNTAFGADAGAALTSGQNNVLIGGLCGDLLTTQFQNTALGFQAMTACGSGGTSGSTNVAIGSNALVALTGASGGAGNTAVGRNAGPNLTTGGGNVFLGHTSGTGFITGTNNTCLGYGTTTDDGSFTLSVSLGIQANITQSRGFVVGATGTNSVQAWLPGVNNDTTLGNATYRFSELFSVNGTINTSDLREKIVSDKKPPGLEFINKLKPISYVWKDKGKRSHFGLGAQDVEKLILDGDVEDFGGFVKAPRNDGSELYTLRMHEFIAPLIQSIQDLHAEVKTLKQEIAEMKGISTPQ
jgi:hypothetical protein